MGSGCGSVGRAVASDSRGSKPGIGKSLNCTVNCIEKMKIKEKEAGNGPFKKLKSS